MAASPTTARSGWSSPAQITDCGAIATMGVTCSATAMGRTALSKRKLGATTRARLMATALAKTSATRAMERVFQAECSSAGALAAAAIAMALGAGRK